MQPAPAVGGGGRACAGGGRSASGGRACTGLWPAVVADELPLLSLPASGEKHRRARQGCISTRIRAPPYVFSADRLPMGRPGVSTITRAPRPLARVSSEVRRPSPAGSRQAGLWFNPLVYDQPVGLGRTSRRRRPRRILLVAAVVARCSGVSAERGTTGGTPHFVDDTPASGINHRYDGEFDYFVGGGVAAFDCDGDGRDELFFAGRSAPAALYHNDSPIGGALRFSPIPSPVTDLTAVVGAYPLDLDSDGHTDLVVLRRGGDVVLGPRRLPLRAASNWGSSCARAGRPPSAPPGRVGTGCRRSPLVGISYPARIVATSAGCCGRRRRALPTPTPSSSRPATARCPFCSATGATRAALTSAVSNDRHYYTNGQEQLWHIVTGEPPTAYTEADGWRPLQIWGMGIASQDVTGDGLPEVFLTSQGDNKLQTLTAGTERPEYRRHRPSSRGHRATALHGWRYPPLDGVASGNSPM